jgi:hypothetical protein
MRFGLKVTIALVVVLMVSAPVGAAPITAPYSIDFGQFAPGPVTVPNLTTSGAATWRISNDGRYTTTVVAPLDPNFPAYGSSAMQVMNLAGQDFELSTRFTYTSTFLGGIHLVAFADNANLSGSSGYRLTRSGNTLIGPEGSTNLNLGSGPYDFILRGDFHDGILDLTGVISDGQNSYSVFSSDSTPSSGQYFGLLVTVSAPNEPVTGSFSHLTIVPEPSALVGVSVVMLVIWRRRGRGGEFKF